MLQLTFELVSLLSESFENQMKLVENNNRNNGMSFPFYFYFTVRKSLK